MINEKRLFISLVRRKRGALERVIELYTPYAAAVIYNIAGYALTKEDIEEVVSDVFIGLWKNIDGLDCEKGTLRAYIAAAARNKALNKLRGAVSAEELNENIVSDCCGPPELAERNEQRRLLLSLIKELGEPDCEIFLRYYWYDEKISHIAAITGMKAATVKTRLKRGREKLRKRLGEVRQ